MYTGPMSQGRLRAVWQITSEAIDELHRSLESRPGETAVAEDPAGLKVSQEGPQGRVSHNSSPAPTRRGTNYCESAHQSAILTYLFYR